MKENKIIIISCALIGIGAVMAGAGYISGGYKDLKEVPIIQNNNKENEYVKTDEELEEFRNIELNVKFGEVEIIQGDKYRIVAEYTEKHNDLSYAVEDDKLVVTNKQSVNFSVLNNDTESNFKIKIYLPKDASLDNLNLKVKSGELTLENLKCKELYAKNDFGEIKGVNIEVDKFEANLQSGSLNLDRFIAENTVINNKFGDIKGKSLITNGLDIDIESGETDIAGKFRGKNNINSKFGTVNIDNDMQKEEYGYDINVKFGECSINGEKCKDDHKSYNENCNNIFNVKCNTGDVKLNFKK